MALESNAVTRVVLGIRDLGLHQQVLDRLERDPRIQVLAATSEADEFAAHARECRGGALVVCDMMVSRVRGALESQTASLRPRVFVVAGQMAVSVLREAIAVGAHGVFAWPAERDDLVRELHGAATRSPEASSARGRVIAVCGARGGAGATFLATHLAAAFADDGASTVLVDLDAEFSDVSTALGIVAPTALTIADLVPVLDELAPDHVEKVLFYHERGFAVLLGPPGELSASVVIPTGLYSGCAALLAQMFDVVILHMPRSVGPVTRTGAEMADERLLVVTQDLLSLHGGRRVLTAFGPESGARPWRVVVNRGRRAEVTASDVERVVGKQLHTTIRFDPAVSRARTGGSSCDASRAGPRGMWNAWPRCFAGTAPRQWRTECRAQ